MFMQMVFSKVHPACHKIANNIKPGRRWSCCWLFKSCMLGRKVIYVRCLNCSYNNVAKGIRLLDKKQFLFIQEKNHASESFWKINTLKGMQLSKAVTWMKLFMHQQNGYFIMETDTLGYIVVWTIYTSQTDHFTPQQTAFEHFAAC